LTAAIDSVALFFFENQRLKHKRFDLVQYSARFFASGNQPI